MKHGQALDASLVIPQDVFLLHDIESGRLLNLQAVEPEDSRGVGSNLKRQLVSSGSQLLGRNLEDIVSWIEALALYGEVRDEWCTVAG